MLGIAIGVLVVFGLASTVLVVAACMNSSRISQGQGIDIERIHWPE